MTQEKTTNKTTALPKALAVLISDIHYNNNTLELADKSLRLAIDHALHLALPLYVCGDTNDTKDVLRGRIVNRLIKTMQYAKNKGVDVYILVGNHDRLHEKAPEHSLEFLRPYSTVIDKAGNYGGINCIPYHHNTSEFFVDLEECRIGEIVLMHQGVHGGDMGNYIQDHSAVDAEDLKNWVTVSGHYHNHHTVGTHTFVGNPFTLTFSEASDPAKGFCVLYDDGSLECIPTNLRKHVIVDAAVSSKGVSIKSTGDIKKDDLVWVKASGTFLDLENLNRDLLNQALGTSSYKLDLIPTDSPQPRIAEAERLPPGELMDALIDDSAEDEFRKTDLKGLWRKVMV